MTTIPIEGVVRRPLMPVLAALSVAHLLNDLVQSMIPALYPLIKDAYRLDFMQIGFITLALSLGDEPTTMTGAMRFLSGKVGLAVLVLGAMHCFNMGAIAQLGRNVNGWVGELQRPATHITPDMVPPA